MTASTSHVPPGTDGRRLVLHFVTGGFSGATQVAIDLCLDQLAGTRIEPVLVLRRKKSTDMARVRMLRESGLQVWVVPGWSHLATVLSLRNLCRRLRPAVMLAHGFPEHLLGRWAGLWAGVPRLVQVEHNSRERYTRWRLAQARWLSRHSAKLVAVSEGVRQSMLQRSMPEELTITIPNGIRLERFCNAEQHGFQAREPGIVMPARFARQKDHRTLIRALALLRARGLNPPLRLAGSGKDRYRQEAQAETARHGLTDQVQFLGHVAQVSELLMSQQICVLATHWEGMPLALIEGMAAGCACVATLAPGVEGLLENECSGLLVPVGDPIALADALERLLRDHELGARLAAAARQRALDEYGVATMNQRYEALLLSL